MRDDLIYGIHVVEHLLRASPEQFLEIYVSDFRDDNRVEAILGDAQKHSIFVNRLQRKQLDQWLPNLNHQGVAAKIRLRQLLSEDELCEALEKQSKKQCRLLVLDGVQDPHNLGACLRTADATGVMAVIIPKDRAATLTPVVRKVASGAAETVPVVAVTNLVRFLERVKTLGFWVVGTSINTEKTLYEVDLSGLLVLVLGAEGTGLRRLTEEHCDILVKIPMAGIVDSLNVSVAAGVCLFEAVRQALPTTQAHIINK